MKRAKIYLNRSMKEYYRVMGDKRRKEEMREKGREGKQSEREGGGEGKRDNEKGSRKGRRKKNKQGFSL